ncbi:hypothetical protein, partial [Shewanella algae]|uniref:hypothetical protein n=2 Tax=Shewanella algae TaxID=38313 RepID=UPI001C589580
MKSAPQVIGCCLTTLFAPTAVGDTEGEIGATLLALSSLKHLKSLQIYTSFPGTGGTVTFRARDGEAELTRMYSQRVTGSPVRERTAGDG